MGEGAGRGPGQDWRTRRGGGGDRGLKATTFLSSKKEGAEAEFPPREEKAAEELVIMEV